MRRTMLVIFSTVLLLSVSRYSCAILAVEDLGEWSRTIQVFNKLKSQAATLKSQYKSITGKYGWGNLKNSLNDLKKDRQWAPSDWKSALKGMAGGNEERYKELVQQYKLNHKTQSQDDFVKGSDKQLAQSYESQKETNQASATTATYEFNDINKHLKELYDLGQKIEDPANSGLKSSMDLNSRIELEVAYISMEELRMQTLLNQQMSQIQSAKIAEENEASMFNQAGENHD